MASVSDMTVAQFISGSHLIARYPTRITFERLLASWRAITTCWWSLLAPAGVTANAGTPRSSTLALCYSAAQYCAPVWSHSAHTGLVDVQLNATVRLISGTQRPTPLPWSSYTSRKHRTTSLEKEGRLSQAGGESSCSWQLANLPWYPSPTTTATVIQESTTARFLHNRHHKSVEARLDFSLGGQLPLSGQPHNPTTRFWPPSMTVVSPDSLPHCARSLRWPAGRDGGKPTPTCVPVESHERCIT